MRTVLMITFLSFFHWGYSYDLSPDFRVKRTSIFPQSERLFSPLNHKKPTFQYGRKRLFLPAANGDEYGAGIKSAAVSLVVPGLGLYMANKQPLSLLLAPLCYGIAGIGVFKMVKGASEADMHYENYLNEKNPNLHRDHLDAMEAGIDKNQSGRIYLQGAALIWVVQTVWTGIYGYYNDKYRKRNAKWKTSISSLYGGYDYQRGMATLNMTIKI